jgi:hypothetical protein
MGRVPTWPSQSRSLPDPVSSHNTYPHEVWINGPLLTSAYSLTCTALRLVGYCCTGGKSSRIFCKSRCLNICRGLGSRVVRYEQNRLLPSRQKRGHLLGLVPMVCWDNREKRD